jgi:molecular chaperone GrpE
MQDQENMVEQAKDESKPEAEGDSGKKVRIAEAELEILKQRAAETEKHFDQFLRAKADLQNYRKRAEREREEIIERANERLIKDLLPVIDNFEIALQSASSSPNSDAIVEGMKLIQSQIQAFLQKQGLEVIDAVGHEFDPAVHEAVAQEASDEPAGKVVGQIRKGYKLGSHIVRPAGVIVSKGRTS